MTKRKLARPDERHNSLSELKVAVRGAVLVELAEIRGRELSDADIAALAERFRGWAPDTNISMQLELARLRGLRDAAVSYGEQEDANDIEQWISALELRVRARSVDSEYPLRIGPRWAVLSDIGLRNAFGRYYDRMSTTRSRALVSLLTHLTLGVGEFPGVKFSISTVEDVIQAEMKAILSLRRRFPEFLAKAGKALRFYAEFDRNRLTPAQLEQLERRAQITEVEQSQLSRAHARER